MNNPKPKPIRIVGCGDIGRRLARLSIRVGHDVMGVVRSRQAQDLCKSIPIDCIRFDLDASVQFEPKHWQSCRIVYFVPPPKQGSTDPRLKTF